MNLYGIYREAGPAARRSAGGYARHRRIQNVWGEGVVDALEQFVYERYLRTGNRQYAGSRIEFQRRGEWLPLDGAPLTDTMERNREWRMTVVLRNGVSEHEAHFVAWLRPGQ